MMHAMISSESVRNISYAERASDELDALINAEGLQEVVR
jgi:hypothetical protein